MPEKSKLADTFVYLVLILLLYIPFVLILKMAGYLDSNSFLYPYRFFFGFFLLFLFCLGIVILGLGRVLSGGFRLSITTSFKIGMILLFVLIAILFVVLIFIELNPYSILSIIVLYSLFFSIVLSLLLPKIISLMKNKSDQ